MGEIFVAGHRGMVGSAILRCLEERGRQVVTQGRAELDLLDQNAVAEYLVRTRPNAVIVAAAKVGGIYANSTYPADFLYQNLMIEANLIHGAHAAGVDRLLFLGSSCIYPRDATQPMPEEALLTGPLEPTNEPYAIAKIAGIKLCESFNRQHGRDYRSVMPTNLYGPGDNFHPENAHVLPALMRRFHEAARDGADCVTIWGSGTPRREFLHVDDLAEAALHVLDLSPDAYASATEPMRSHINVGTGADMHISALAAMIAEITGFRGRIDYDRSRPDGTPQKRLDVSRLAALGWTARIPLREGIERTYAWYKTAAIGCM